MDVSGVVLWGVCVLGVRRRGLDRGGKNGLGLVKCVWILFAVLMEGGRGMMWAVCTCVCMGADANGGGHGARGVGGHTHTHTHHISNYPPTITQTTPNQALLALLGRLRLRKLHVHWCQEAVTDRVLEVRSEAFRLFPHVSVCMCVCVSGWFVVLAGRRRHDTMQ